MRLAFALLLSFGLSLQLAQPFAQAAESYPKDVLKYAEQRENCYHMSGEIPDGSDKAAMREVIREINRQCKGLDKKKRQLTRKYAGNPEVTARLARVEAESEDIYRAPSQPAN